MPIIREGHDDHHRRNYLPVYDIDINEEIDRANEQARPYCQSCYKNAGIISYLKPRIYKDDEVELNDVIDDTGRQQERLRP